MMQNIHKINNNNAKNRQVYENIYNDLKEYMFYPDVINNNMVELIRNNNNNSNSNSINNNNNSNSKVNNNVKKEFISNNQHIHKHPLTQTETHNKKNIIEKENKEETQSPFFIPQEKDKLFWCLYIFIHGEYDYKIAKNNTFAIEKKWKMDTLSKLKEKDVMDFLKLIKVKVADLEDELMNKEKLSLKGLQLFCMIYKLSVIYVSGRKYCEFLYNNEDSHDSVHDTAKTFVIMNMQNKEDGIYRNPDDKFIKNIRDTYWKMENVHKPLKGASSYSLTELQDICTKMGVELVDAETKKKKTMKVLYQELLMHF
jgi:hypothetical protein